MTKKTLIAALLSLLSFVASAQLGTAYTELTKKAKELYEARQYRQSAEAYVRAFDSAGGKGFQGDRFRAACSWAMAGNKDSAFVQLNKIAVKTKFDRYDQLINDKGLEGLHNDARWNEVVALVKQNKEKADATMNKLVMAMLDTIFKDDQEERQQFMPIQQKYGNDSKEMKEWSKKVGEKDSVNVIKVTRILDQYGWLGSDVVGGRGNATLFLVIQHASIKVQEKYLPMMRDAVKNKKALASDLALLEDRVALGEGKKQIYGSQISMDKSGNFMAPMEDPDNVDKRRAEVGLEPIAKYVEFFGLKWDLDDYKKHFSETEKRQRQIHND